MKTQIIQKKDWFLLKQYNLLIPMTKGDVVEINEIEYKIINVVLCVDKNVYQIII